MAILEILARAEARLQGTISSEMIRKLSEMRRRILEQIESRTVAAAAGKHLPYQRIDIDLCPASVDMGDMFWIAFQENDSLREDVRWMLESAHVRCPDSLYVAVGAEPVEPGAAGHADGLVFHNIRFLKINAPGKAAAPSVRLIVFKGAAEEEEYHIRKERILIGRSSEVTDREGRVIRKNDIVFLDNGDGVNSTVGYAHARIWWDCENGDCLIMDEVSRYGTGIMRKERWLEAPAGNPCGLCLQSGDSVYCGQAGLRFEFES